MLLGVDIILMLTLDRDISSFLHCYLEAQSQRRLIAALHNRYTPHNDILSTHTQCLTIISVHWDSHEIVECSSHSRER